jgi:hypothetical protein
MNAAKLAIVKSLLPILVERLAALLTTDMVKELLDGIFDKIEDFIADTDNVYDDLIVGTLIRQIREALDIPDGDD